MDCLAVVVRYKELAPGGGGVSTPGVGCRGFIQNTSKQRGLEEEEETRGGGGGGGGGTGEDEEAKRKYPGTHAENESTYRLQQRRLEEEEETRGGVSAHSDFLLQVHRVLSFESP